MGILLEKLLEMNNMERAFNKAKRKKTIGIDKIAGKEISDKNGYLNDLSNKISCGLYSPIPPVIITKLNYDNIKTITLHVQAFRDQVVEFAIKNILYDCWEPLFRLYPYSARRGKEEKVFIDYLQKSYMEGNNYIITDIRKFTDSITVELLYKDLYACCKDRDLLDLIDKCLFTFHDKTLGLPLGHILTTFLPNIYLLDIEKQLTVYFRYFDCFVFPYKYEEPGNILNYFADVLNTKHLSMNDEKTKILIRPSLDKLLAAVKGV